MPRSLGVTPIALVRDHVEDWRRAAGMSRESAAQVIVETHERLGLDTLTGIAFDPPTRDTFERMRVNADKIFRWLDDHTKDRNLLTVNFLWSILATLPIERRIALVEALLEPVGLAVTVEDTDDADHGGDEIHAVVLHIQTVATTSADATVSLTQLIDGVDPGEAAAARKNLARLAAAVQPAIRLMTKLWRREKKGARQ